MSAETPVPADPWNDLRRHTPARIALGRTGVSLPTREVLNFALAHAQARDAIHRPLETAALTSEVVSAGWDDVIVLESNARDRSEYLLRPDKGRRLSAASAARIQARHDPRIDLAVVIGDGLSAHGIQAHSASLLGELRKALSPELRLGPLVLVRQARVAVGDDVGAILGAGMVAMIIGERPGLNASDSIGVYLTFAPRPGCTDAQRNCISNIRPGGQSFDVAARRIAWLITEGRRLGQTGIALKDQSGLIAPY